MCGDRKEFDRRFNRKFDHGFDRRFDHGLQVALGCAKSGNLALGTHGNQVATEAIALAHLAQLLFARLPMAGHLVEPAPGQVSRSGGGHIFNGGHRDRPQQNHARDLNQTLHKNGHSSGS